MVDILHLLIDTFYSSDVLAALVELLGYHMLAKRNNHGFLVLMASLVLWMYTGLINQIYGIILYALPTFVIFFRAYLRWTREKHARTAYNAPLALEANT